MSIKTFLEFPGILVTIGIVLLIISIIIIIIAIKSDKKEDFKIKNNDFKEEIEPNIDNNNNNATQEIDFVPLNEYSSVDNTPVMENNPNSDRSLSMEEKPLVSTEPVEVDQDDEDIELL